MANKETSEDGEQVSHPQSADLPELDLAKLSKPDLLAEAVELRGQLEALRLQTRFGLVWEERPELVEPEHALEEARGMFPVLTEEPGLAVGEGDNPIVLMEGDNYHALMTLTYTHEREVDVIYIDPPYNTGNEDFKYNDRFVDDIDEYRHSKWLNFMAPRIELAQRLLKDTGVIIVSIDDNEFAQLKLLLDRAFNERNFIGNIVRATNSTKSNSNFLSVNYDYTLVYAKNKAALEAHIKAEDAKWQVNKNNIAEYKKQIATLKRKKASSDEITSELKELTKYPRFIDFVNYWYVDDRGVYRKGDLGGVKNGNKEPILNPLTKKPDPVPPGGFRFRKEELERLIKEDRIHFHTDGSLPTVKRYLDENPKQRPKGIMSDDQRPDANLLEGMGIEFDNPKQLAFIERILSIFNDDAVILDFFAGSGTTGHAVLKLNAEDGGSRKCVLVTDNESSICREVTYVRLKKAIEGYTDLRAKRKSDAAKKKGKKGKTAAQLKVAGLGGGLRFFKVEPTVFNTGEVNDDLRAAFREHATDLMRVREWCFEPVLSQAQFAVYGSSSKVLAILLSHKARTKLIDKLEKKAGERPIVLYGFSLAGALEGSDFKEAFDGRITFEGLPDELLNTYQRVFQRELHGGWTINGEVVA